MDKKTKSTTKLETIDNYLFGNQRIESNSKKPLNE